MYQLPHSILKTCIEYMVPNRFVLRDGVDANKYIRGVYHFNYFYTKHYPLPILTHDTSGTLFLHHEGGNEEDEMIACSDFKISAMTMVLIDGTWHDCNPDNDTMTYLLSFPEKRNPYCNQNPHPVLVRYLINHPEEMVWYIFSTNSNTEAIHYLLQRTYMIDWISFCKNPSKEAVQYLLEHPEHIDWITFSHHPYLFEQVNDVKLQHEWNNTLKK